MSYYTIIKIIFIKIKISYLRYINILFKNFYSKKTYQKNKFKALYYKGIFRDIVFKNVFGPYANGIVYKSYNGLLFNYPKDIQVSTRLGFDGSLNKTEIEILLKHVNKKSNVFVLGTHIGSLLIPIAENVNTVVGFEANPKTFEALESNIRLNDLKNVKLFNLAVSNEEKELEFLVNNSNSGSSKIKPAVDNLNYKIDTSEIINVKANTLDVISKKYNLESPNMIVMDIEGSEYFALMGATETLKSVNTLYMEFFPSHINEVSGISIGDFIAVLEMNFSKVQVIQELINGDTTVHENLAFKNKIYALYDSDTDCDLLLLK